MAVIVVFLANEVVNFRAVLVEVTVSVVSVDRLLPGLGVVETEHGAHERGHVTQTSKPKIFSGPHASGIVSKNSQDMSVSASSNTPLQANTVRGHAALRRSNKVALHTRDTGAATIPPHVPGAGSELCLAIKYLDNVMRELPSDC